VAGRVREGHGQIHAQKGSGLKSTAFLAPTERELIRMATKINEENPSEYCLKTLLARAVRELKEAFTT
jgi:hypothetical protein